MRYTLLGKTDLKVSELCFGVLPMGPLQNNLPVAEGADILLSAMQNGVNFFDTAQLYQTYAHVRRAMENYHKDIILASKSTATDYATMEKAIIEGLHEVRRDYFDIFFLHSARAEVHDFTKWAGAWQCLLDYKQKGYIRYTGISTHVVEVVKTMCADPELDVLFSLSNMTGKGVIGGGAAEMRQAVTTAAEYGIGQYSMKSLAGGTLLGNYREAIAYNRAIPGYQSHALGMSSNKELNMALRLFNDQTLSDEEVADIKSGKSWMLMNMVCIGCGRCVEHCPSGSLRVEDGICKLNPKDCVLCGYCSAACPEFAIRVK